MASENYKLSFKNQFRTMASLTVYRTGSQQCPPGFSRGEEVRSFYLIHYVFNGKGTYIINGAAHPVSAGQAFLIYPGVPINYIADEKNPWEYRWVGFDGADARVLLNSTGFSRIKPVISIKNHDGMMEEMGNIYNKRGNLPHQVIAMTGALYSLLSFLIKENFDEMPKELQGVSNTVQQACNFIATHYSSHITVEDVAKSVGLSRSQLYRLFKSQLMMSPQQYLIDFRIRSSCSLMDEKDFSVKEAAYFVGFDDPLYFSSVFKKIIGKTPKEYLMMLRENGEKATDASAEQAEVKK